MSNRAEPGQAFWKQKKQRAHLHDPPSKCVDIGHHEEHARTLFRQAGLIEEAEEYAKHFAQPSDWTAAAADRLPFPESRAAGLSCQFDGHRNQFHHPRAAPGAAARLPFHAPFTSAEVAKETDQGVQPALTEESLVGLSEGQKWRARFLLIGAFGPGTASPEITGLLSCPLTREFPIIPSGPTCRSSRRWTDVPTDPARTPGWHPRFSKFQLGPVQDFISAARSIRDLWSGSYLLSWLMAAGMKALSAEIGPDAVVFPNLRDQPLFDLHWRDDLWGKVKIGTSSVWDSRWSERDLLTPNLPNVFLAVVPATRANELARLVKEAIEQEWERIASAVWTECEKADLTRDEGDFTAGQRKERFDAQ